MKKLAIGILAVTLVFLIAPGVFAQPPWSYELHLLYGGGVMTDGVDSLYFGLRAGDIKIYMHGEPKLEQSGGFLIIVSHEGPVLTCVSKDAVINCGDDSFLTCEDGTEVTVNDNADTLSFNGVTYDLEHGIIKCRYFSGP
jgi:hypothetical protein